MSQNIDIPALEQVLAKYFNGLKQDIKDDMEKLKKELISEMVYNNRNLEKKIEGCSTSSVNPHSPKVEAKKADDFDLNSSTSFNWVKDHLKDLNFPQIVDFFKQIIQRSNINCESVNTRDFGRNQNSFYKILDSVWDQLSSYLEINDSNDIYKAALKGVASLISGLTK